jgi:hypothetical protein
MEIQEIEVIIDKNGEVKIQVHGVNGSTCLDLTADLEAALSGEVISREMTVAVDAVVQEQVRQNQNLKDGG